MVCSVSTSKRWTCLLYTSAMKTNRTYNLGVLFVDERQSGLAHEYFSAVLDSLDVYKRQVLGFFNAVCQVYTTIIRGTPMMVQLLIMSMVISVSYTHLLLKPI